MSLDQPLREADAPGRSRASGVVFWAVAGLGLALTASPLRILPPPAPPVLFPLAILFFWTVFRTAAVPVWSVAILGLVQDALTGAPWGAGPAGYASAMIFVWTAAPALRRERFGALWIGALIAFAAYALGSWAACCLAARRWVDTDPFAFQAAVTAAFYPLLHRLFVALDAATRRMG